MADGKSGVSERAVIGGGCFWCVEAVFEQIAGIIDAVSGYAGGTVENPSYEQVCTGNTGHAEVVELTFDPDRITFRQILATFFKSHDPTTPNRQGADVGSQYRSIILYAGENQKAEAKSLIAELQNDLRDPIITQVVPLTTFFEAEAYHQDYFRKNPFAGYCAAVIRPKLSKLGLKTR